MRSTDKSDYTSNNLHYYLLLLDLLGVTFILRTVYYHKGKKYVKEEIVSCNIILIKQIQ